MPKPAAMVTGSLLLFGLFVLVTHMCEWKAMMTITTFALGPLVINLLPASLLHSRIAQGIVSIAAVGYFVWLAFVYQMAVTGSPATQPPAALIFASLYAMPVMVLLWIAAGTTHWMSGRTVEPSGSKAAGKSTSDPDNPYLPPRAS